MKSIKIMAAAIALCGMTACGDNTPKTFTGFITDASMNTVTVENAEGTFTFSTMDADKSEANGLLLGAPVVVDYKGKLEDGAAADAGGVAVHHERHVEVRHLEDGARCERLL